ncbi:MAG: hypothetical protein LBF27_33205 [Sphingobacterium sp.]|jgi:hypothetical protein|nr:hypothetical protein [Sphingobacterium sp.]
MTIHKLKIKKTCTFLLLLLWAHHFYSQQNVAGGQLDRQILDFPTSPNAYSFNKVGKLPMDLFNGKANISIPIYSVNMGGLSFPIGLSYNTGGIRQNEIASSVGLGWALSMPNSISKSIFDKDDDISPLFFTDFNHAAATLGYFDIYNFVQQEDMESISTGNYDLKPDLFTYSLPEMSGSFIVRNNQGYTIPHEDIKIEKTAPGYKITDTKGNRYWLSPSNLVLSKSTGQTSQISQNQISLDSLRTASGDALKFEYQKVQKYDEKTVYEKRYIFSLQDNAVPYGFHDFPHLDSNPPNIINTEKNTEKLISKIIFPEGEINFLYSGDEGLQTTSGVTYRKDLDSETGGKALKKIVVKNKSGQIIKQISFNYSYFESANPNKTYLDYRLRLTEVIDDLEGTKHSFTYNENYPLPARNGNSDDLWGYFNSITPSGSNVPYIYGENLQVIGGSRNRDTSTLYSQLGILTKIKYPTGAEKKLYYENNSTASTSPRYIEEDIDEIFSDILVNPNDLTVTKTVTIDPSFQNVKAYFGNGCLNNSGSDEFPEGGDYSSCRGFITIGNATSIYKVTQTIPLSYTGQPIQLKLTRFGDCGCSLKLTHGYTVQEPVIQAVGGLRVKQIEDIDQNNVSNVYYYDYNNSGILKRKFSFFKPYYRVAEPMLDIFATDPDVGYIAPADFVHEIREYQTAGNAYTSYNSSNIMTYSKVTERNGLGEVIHTFTDDDQANYNPYSYAPEAYTSWQKGLPLSTIYKKGSDTLRKETFHYEFNPLKNSKAGFVVGTPDEMAFGIELFMVKYHNSHGMPVDLTNYRMTYLPIPIYGAKIEMKQSKTTEYFQNNKMIETVTDNIYSDTDINKPINLKSSVSTLSSGESTKTEYQYAHEKNNQLMIDKNMIGIPLETQATKTMGSITKILSKTETIYPSALPHPVAGNLVLPLSLQSYNIQNPAAAQTEVTYDKYDDKGNIIQYTTKDGVPVSIVWGYNKTLPIIKIEGIAYSQLENMISTYIADSDADALDPSKESLLLIGYQRLRKDVSLTGKLITTYSYDPLIGVTSITPPSGILEKYIYDSTNRLQKVEDVNGKIIKEYQYHFKN